MRSGKGGQELVETARRLHSNPNGRAPSLRKIAAALAEEGFFHPERSPHAALVEVAGLLQLGGDLAQ